jgi:hypothetical protein
MGQIWEQTQTFWFHFLLDVGTFVERLWNVCGTFVERVLLYCFGITIYYYYIMKLIFM